MISYVFSLVGVPSASGPPPPQIYNNPHRPSTSSPPHVTPVFWGRNHRLPSCSVSLFFQTPIHVHLPFQHVLHYHSPRNALSLQPVHLCLSLKKKKNVVCTSCSYLHEAFLTLFPLCPPPPLSPQTPSGLLLAHSPLLSGIHFWSSLSPVAPLSPARLQGHSSLFQVRSAH